MSRQPNPPKAKCSRCHRRPRTSGQRYCAICRKLYMRGWRERQREELLYLRERVAKLERRA